MAETSALSAAIIITVQGAVAFFHALYVLFFVAVAVGFVFALL